MLTTVVAVFAAIALLVPGFLVAEIALARGARSSRRSLRVNVRLEARLYCRGCSRLGTAYAARRLA
jgi:UPF0716 family protein affecting phage T7 exclusion